MVDHHQRRARYVTGPDGRVLTVANLPPRDTKRWVIRRKAELVAAVRGGLLSLEEACERYTLTVDEFLSWQRSIERYGLPRPEGDASARLPGVICRSTPRDPARDYGLS